MNEQIDPSHIMQVGMGFWGSKTLLSAVELELFTKLAPEPMSGPQIAEALALDDRAIPDFPDALVALGLLDRDGEGGDATYRNTEATALFLDKASPAYLGGFLEMANARLYPFWGDLTEALRSGSPQNEVKQTGRPPFEELYSDPDRLEQFMRAMVGISRGPAMALTEKFDFSRYETLCDAGGADRRAGADRRPPPSPPALHELRPAAGGADRPANHRAAGLGDRVTAAAGDFFADPLPKADVITMGHILHDWDLERKMELISAAYDALPDGGAFIGIENLIDDARRENAFGLLMSLNMLIETGDGFDFTGADFAGWCKEVGFKKTEVLSLAGPTSAAVAYK